MLDRLATTELAIEESTPEYHRGCELWAAACRRETTLIASALQPRHRRAVKKMAKALEALSIAMTEEHETRAELHRTAPERESAHLPDCSHDLNIGTLADWNSPASGWARRMRKLTILE